MEPNEEDLQIRRMAQEAKLDQDLESMVPPTSRRSTILIIFGLFCLAAISLAAILLAALG